LYNLYSVTKGQQANRELAGAMRDRTGNLPPLSGIFSDYAAPKVALKRAILMTASTQEQRDEVLGVSNEQRAAVPDAQQTSSQIVCSHCGQVNPAT
jgi:hypothetical protein